MPGSPELSQLFRAARLSRMRVGDPSWTANCRRAGVIAAPAAIHVSCEIQNMMEIVCRWRGLSWLYDLFVLAFVLLGILLLPVAMGRAAGEDPWTGKWMSVAGFAVAGLSWLMGVPRMCSLAKSYGRNEVRLDGSRFALHTPAGHDLELAFCDVRQVS